MDGESAYTRRGLLRAAGGATAAVAVASAAGPAAAQTDFDGWLSDVGNYDGTVVDATGQEEATVEVGVEANGGAYGFGPAAVQVDPGTTVRWEWTGEGQQHNVVDEAGNFESDLTSEEGFTYERTFDSAGVVKYFCRPHRGLGMKGVVVVGDLPDTGGEDGGGGSGEGGGDGGGSGGEGGGGNGGEGGGGDSGPPNSANDTALQTLAAMIVLGLLSPLLFLVLLRRRQREQSDRRRRYTR
ncbi:halocyanin domain-containing protein [Salinirussus salinus]|jgi:halocyanin-like protein|uniref:halocyanin domain-containing protein n=1 Tax=Salinirussus salinus TaxID=1198300 RepID=UPI00135AD5F9|nr:halocyanin domain-containing protein [Salinirussus salinus]